MHVLPKRLRSFQVGVRESAQSWHELLVCAAGRQQRAKNRRQVN
jgi:hypothetical protein